VTFFLGLFLGIVVGVIVLGFLAVDSYGRGYEDADMRRHERRAELAARHFRARERRLGAHA
jgi:hypothetical protein